MRTTKKPEDHHGPCDGGGDDAVASTSQNVSSTVRLVSAPNTSTQAESADEEEALAGGKPRKSKKPKKSKKKSKKSKKATTGDATDH